MPAIIQPGLHNSVYRWHEGVENLDNYVLGGYHPVHLGDKYHKERYQVVHKLGYGSYSCVWLARDTTSAKFVALKILRADASENSSESSILVRLASGPENHPGRSGVARLVDQFYIAGPNGRHQCIVTNAAGYPIAQSKECSTTWKFPVNVARGIAARFLRALSYVHSCGVVHGDLHTNNILIKWPCFEASTCDELYQVIGPPQKLLVQRVDGQPLGPEAPRYCVPSARTVCSAEEVAHSDVLIADFGEAFICDSGNRTDVALHTPMLLIPPEFIFKESLGPAVDIWTAACTLYEILGERPLFEGFMPDENHVVAEMISTLGPLPNKWWQSWPAKEEYFLEDGSWDQDTTRCHAPCSRPLSSRMPLMGRAEGTGKDEFESGEIAILEGLLRRMFAYDPAQRVTAQDLETEPWMVRYGLKAKE